MRTPHYNGLNPIGETMATRFKITQSREEIIGRGCQKSRRAFLSATLPLPHRPSGFTAEGKATSGALRNQLRGRTKIHRRYFWQPRLIATGGIAMVGALLNDNRGLASLDKMTTDRIKKGWISNSGIIKSVVGLFTLARNDFADIAMFRDELSFRLALELERVPSEETLRQRLDLIAKLNSQQTLLDYAMRDLLRKVESFGTVKIGKHKLIPLDIDVATTERLTHAKTGEVFLFPEIEIDSWWTNIDCTEEECIAGYHDHGTSEQFHSELKTDMNIEKLPSGKFATNALILNIAALAFNCLRIMGQRFLDKPQLLHREYKVARRRLRSVMQDLI